MQKGGVWPSVGDTVFVAPQRAHADATERKDPLLAIALGVQAVSQLVAQLTDAFFISKVRTVFECQVRHGYLLIAHSHFIHTGSGVTGKMALICPVPELPK